MILRLGPALSFTLFNQQFIILLRLLLLPASRLMKLVGPRKQLCCLFFKDLLTLFLSVATPTLAFDLHKLAMLLLMQLQLFSIAVARFATLMLVING